MKPERKNGKPYIWVTWLAGLLGGKQCIYSAWFRARYKYDKFEEEAKDLTKWNREHTTMMKARATELEELGFTVTLEEGFKLEGEVAIVAGKIDILGVQKHADGGSELFVVDGKTGQRRDSDWWQVLIYLFAVPRARKDLVGDLTGEVHYKRGDERIAVLPSDLTPERKAEIVGMIKLIAGEEAPRKVATRDECKRCNIGVKDCPERKTADNRAAKVSDW